MRRPMGQFTYTTAIVIIPPAEVWSPIQAIREKHDAKVRRWMPHITLVYPFLPVTDWPAAHEPLATVCRTIPSFEIELVEFSTFHHRRGNHMIWLRPEPEAPLVGLQPAIQHAALGTNAGTGRQVFQPHLSVGQVRGKAEMLRLVTELQAAWRPARFEVSSVSLISRSEPPDDVFRVAMTIPLAKTTSG